MSKLYTTVESIKKLNSCQESLDWFLAGYNGKFKDNERIPMSTFLKIHSRRGYKDANINPVQDVLWMYGKAIFPKRKAKKVILTFITDLIEEILPIFEKKYPGDNRPRVSIDTLRGYLRGEKTLKQLRNATCAADAAYAATDEAYTADAVAHAATKRKQLRKLKEILT